MLESTAHNVGHKTVTMLLIAGLNLSVPRSKPWFHVLAKTVKVSVYFLGLKGGISNYYVQRWIS